MNSWFQLRSRRAAAPSPSTRQAADAPGDLPTGRGGSGTRSSGSRSSRGRSLRRRVQRLFEKLETRDLMAVSPPLDTTIEAVTSDQNTFNNGGIESVPPDTHGTVGPGHVLNVTNSTIEWYTKSGTQQASTSLTNFFRPLQPAGALGPFDPKALYDHFSNRYVVVALEVLDTANGDSANTSRMMLAVSDDSDPNGTWHYQSINTILNISGAPQWLDYPGFALDEEAIYVTGNMFPFGTGTGTPGGSRLWIVDKGVGKGGLYEGGRSAANIYNPAGSNATTSGFTLQPALMYGPGPSFGNNGTQVGTWLTAYNGTSSGGNETVLVIRVDNPLTTPVFTSQTVAVGNIDDTANTGFTTPPGPLFLPGAPQPGGTALIRMNDRRMLNAVWRNNSLYATATVLPTTGPDLNQTTAHWFRFDTSNVAQVAVADQGDIGGEDIGSNVWTGFGSVAVDPAGNMAIGFSAVGAGMFAGSYYAVRSPSDPPGTMRGARAIALGQDYHDQGPLSRWGDYTAIAVDPSDNASFWSYNLYARPRSDTNTGRYGTRWGAFHLADIPPTPGTSTPPAYVTGLKFNDLDRDGIRDANEFGVGGFTMYVDLNGNDKIDIGEPAANTDAFGNYTIESKVFGTFAIREVSLTGWTQTFPGASAGFEHTVSLVSGQTRTDINFGNSGQLFDFGDAPAPYPTTLGLNGARAGFKAGFHLGFPTINVPSGGTLGVDVDVEADSQPDANAQGDDLNGSDDEDGVQFPASGLVAGANAVLTISVANGGGPSGAVQGWIDFNGDGIWSSPGEQVIKDLVLTQGTHNITVQVPANATSQLTYARFRYGYERGIGPTGAALVGEVEDYAVQIISDQPIANDDVRQFNQNSTNNVVDVLTNDFASSQGGLRLQTVGVPNRGGTAVIDNRGTTTPADDIVRYSPLVGFVGTETFTYTITDNSNRTDSATVTITVASLSANPVAVDDSFTFPTALAAQLNVLANDTVGDRGPITIASVTQPPTGQGIVSILAGGTLLQYSPPSTSFVGDVQFSYTIQDAQTPTRRTSTTTVTLHVGNTAADDKVAIILRPFDLNGRAITVVNPGQEFEIRAFVKDLRTDDTVGNPTDNLGVYAAYFDYLYEPSLVSVAGPVVFNGSPSGPWTSGQTAGTNTIGIIDESGAFQGGSPVFTADEIELYRVRMRANAVGQADFAADPADIVPLHDVLTFQPPATVALSQITYGTTSLFIGDPATVLFKAIDDTITVNANSGNNVVGPQTLNVLANDLRGLNTPVTIISASMLDAAPTDSVAVSGGGTTLTYTPPSGGINAVRQLRYTIRDSAGNTSDAVVTLFLGNAGVLAANDQAGLRLEATDVNGSPITSVAVGSTFQLRLYAEDLRSGVPNSQLGVYAAYLDIIYDYARASFSSITYSPTYFNGQRGDAQFPGLIDEIGSFQTGSSAVGPGEQLILTVNMQATSTGIFTFRGDLRDNVPLNAVTLFSPPTNVAFDQIRLNSSSITVTAGGAGGEAEFTNPSNAFDVNGDGFVTPIDVLMVINDVNAYGARALSGGAAGEAPANRVFLDVNADRFVSPLDALLVINFLNARSGGAAGEGEGVGAAILGGNSAALVDETLAGISSDISSINAGSSAFASANGVSGSAAGLTAFATPAGSPSVVSNSKPFDAVVSEDHQSDDEGESIDSLIEGLASDVAESWEA
ncbi:MAG: Ig-like domain-containing protein [Planctomycetota bacterium]